MASPPLSERGTGNRFVETIAQLTQNWEQRPSWKEYFMATALLIASRSACQRLRVGCILVASKGKGPRIIASGYNGFLPGAPHISKMRDGHELATVHAEQNAIADASRRGVPVEGAEAYLTHFPCIHCSKILAAAGISTLYYHSDYDNDPLVYNLLSEVGIPINQL